MGVGIIGMARILIVEDDLAMWVVYVDRLDKVGREIRALKNGVRIE